MRPRVCRKGTSGQTTRSRQHHSCQSPPPSHRPPLYIRHQRFPAASGTRAIFHPCLLPTKSEWPHRSGRHSNQTAVSYPQSVSDCRALESAGRSEEHTSELQSRPHLVCRLLLEKKKYHLTI